MERGDLQVIILIIILLIIIALVTVHLDRLFPTPDIGTAISMVNSS